MPYDLTTGQWIKARRKFLDLTQEGLAQLVGCATETIRSYESDERRPSKELAKKLTENLQIPSKEQEAFTRWFRKLPLSTDWRPLPPDWRQSLPMEEEGNNVFHNQVITDHDPLPMEEGETNDSRDQVIIDQDPQEQGIPQGQDVSRSNRIPVGRTFALIGAFVVLIVILIFGTRTTRETVCLAANIPGYCPNTSAPKINIASLGEIEVSSISTQGGEDCQTGEKAVDGVISGNPENPCSEWASDGELAGAWLRVSFDAPHQISKVVLYDRPNPDDQILDGTLRLSDGTVIKTGELPDNGRAKEFTFPTKNINCLELTVDRTRGAVIGLSEIEIIEQE